MRARSAARLRPTTCSTAPSRTASPRRSPASFAPALGVQDPYNATPEQVALIQRGHLLVAHANAMIPGVFALSAWDLVGALPVPLDSIPNESDRGRRLALDQSRWCGPARTPTPRRRSRQVRAAEGEGALRRRCPSSSQTPNSFASQIKQMLAARKQYRIHRSRTMSRGAERRRSSVCVLVMTLPDSGGHGHHGAQLRRA